MPRALSLSVAASISVLLVSSPVMADPAGLKTLAIGAKAPDFKLPGVDGKTYSLADFKDANVLVVLFTCNHCPTAQAYEGRVADFVKKYREKGVALVAISPNDPKAVRLDELGYTDLSDSFDDMKVRAKDHAYDYPYLYDGETQATSLAYGALATPHVFVFDRDRVLRYNGRFDDQEVKEPTSHDTINAVDALLAGKAVPVATTRVFGCSTKWSDKRQSAVESLAKWDAEAVEIEPVDVKGLREIAENSGGKYTLVNLWATWCGPCVQELPDLVEMNRMYRGRPFQMITISLDDSDKKTEALEVLRKNHVATRNLIYASDDRDALGDALDKEWPGPIPYTLLIAPGGKVLHRWTGAADPLEVKRAIVEAVGRTYAAR